MPPRYAYWTILIDKKATAFRAREREELLPTFHQLKRKNADVVMKWYARGRLWESPIEAQAALRAPNPPAEKRGAGWRPGGEHRDPRERFKKRGQPHGARPAAPSGHQQPAPRRESRPWSEKPRAGQPRSSPTGTRANRPAGKTPWRRDSAARTNHRKPWNTGRRGAEAPPKRHDESPATPLLPEEVVVKPKPPERG